ncbi:MAG: hypothetical protein HY892_00455 [Deltaproteobacteria bacterium]|nr:hypothetical protein [Deltaproteobacteria bacterium]
MKRNNLLVLVLAVGFLITTGLSPARAEILDKSDHWKSFFSIYGWVPAMSGDVKVKGLESDLDVTYSDIFNNTNFFFMAHYEGFKGRWGIMVDGLYADLEAEKEHPGGSVPGRRQVKIQQSLIEAAVPYRLTWNPVVADVFVGGRYNYIHAEIAIPSVPVKKDDTLAFVDPIVGGRVFIPLAKNWFLGLRGDIGGFGIGNASDLALNGNASINWQINEVFSLHGGYRALYMKYNEGENEWNATQHGPWAGIGFSF